MPIKYDNLGFVRSIAFDVLFCLYIFFLEPLLLPELKSYVNQPYSYRQHTYWIACILIAALLCEVPGMYLKFRSIGEKMLKKGLGKPGERIWLKWGFVIYLFHTAVFLLVAISAFRALGLTMHDNENLFRLLFIAYLVLEGAVTYFIFSAKIPEGPRPHALMLNILGETCLFFFGVIAFTVTWRINPVIITDFSPGSIAAMLVGSILFLMFYLPCNLATVYDNFLTATSRRQVFYRIASLVLVILAAMFPLNSRAAEKWKTIPDQSAFEVIRKTVDFQLYKQRLMEELDALKRAR